MHFGLFLRHVESSVRVLITIVTYIYIYIDVYIYILHILKLGDVLRFWEGPSSHEIRVVWIVWITGCALWESQSS